MNQRASSLPLVCHSRLTLGSLICDRLETFSFHTVVSSRELVRSKAVALSACVLGMLFGARGAHTSLQVLLVFVVC